MSFLAMINRRLLFFILISIVVTIFSCKDDVVEAPVDQHYGIYYPVEEGFWIEYAVDSIVHLDSDDPYLVDTSILTYHFQVREQIDTPFVDGEGDTAFVVIRYRRDADTMPWEFSSIWTSKLTANSLQRVEDNRRYVRLSFPITVRSHWNGNAYNDLDPEDYSYDDLFQSLPLNTFTFDSTVTVIQNDFTSNINRIYKKEIYANHAGLIFKQLDSVNTAISSGSTIILNGIEYSQTVTDYAH